MLDINNVTSLEEHWQTYDRATIPAAASAGQRLCMRDAFYAGLITMYALVTSNAFCNLPEEDAMALLDKYQADILKYSDEIASRSAALLASRNMRGGSTSVN